MAEKQTETPAGKAKRVTDNEVKAMADLVDVMNRLDEDECGRVVCWLWNRYMPGVSVPGGRVVLGSTESPK